MPLATPPHTLTAEVQSKSPRGRGKGSLESYRTSHEVAHDLEEDPDGLLPGAKLARLLSRRYTVCSRRGARNVVAEEEAEEVMEAARVVEPPAPQFLLAQRLLRGLVRIHQWQPKM